MPYNISAANSTPTPWTGQIYGGDSEETPGFWQQRLTVSEPGVVMPIDSFRRLAGRAIAEAARRDSSAADLLRTIRSDKVLIASMNRQPVIMPVETARRMAGWAFPGISFEEQQVGAVVIPLPTNGPQIKIVQTAPYQSYGT